MLVPRDSYSSEAMSGGLTIFHCTLHIGPWELKRRFFRGSEFQNVSFKVSTPTYSFLSILVDFEIVAEYLLMKQSKSQIYYCGRGKKNWKRVLFIFCTGFPSLVLIRLEDLWQVFLQESFEDGSSSLARMKVWTSSEHHSRDASNGSEKSLGSVEMIDTTGLKREVT